MKIKPQVIVLPFEPAGVALFYPSNMDAARWIALNCPPDKWEHFSGSLSVTSEYAGRLIAAMREAGISVVIGKV